MNGHTQSETPQFIATRNKSKSASQEINFKTDKTAETPDVSLIAPMHKNTISVKIAQCRTSALVDTGASISCISQALMYRSGLSREGIETCSLKQITGVGGEHHRVLGIISVPLVISGLCFPYKFYVLEQLHHSIILGIDFLHENQCFIDLGSNTLHLKDNLITSKLNVSSAKASVIRQVTLKAREETTIPVFISKTKRNREVLLEPINNHNFTSARCLVKTKRYKHFSKANLRILNPTNSDVTLKPKTVVALVSEVDSDNVFELSEDKSDISVNSVSNVVESAHTQSINFNIHNSDLTQKQITQLTNFLNSNKDVFATSLDKIGKTNVFMHKIETEPGSKPVHKPCYRYRPEIKAEIQRQTNEMLESEIIQPSSSVWNSPVVLVKKKDNSWRFAIDYRSLNKITIPISHPLPRLEDVFDCIGEASATIFSTLDLNSAYFQIELDPETKHKSAFITHDGVYEFNRMPFGLRNAPMSFQMLMSQVLRGLHWKIVLCYIDDILVFSKTFEEHLYHLSQVFSRLREANLTLKPEKCQFGLEKVKYLGHVLSKNGVSVDTEKTDKVRNFPIPTSQKELKSFLGLCNYYRRFVKGFAKIASPLNFLLKGNKKGKFKSGDWTDECQRAFQNLKDALISPPILGFPDMNKKFILSTDASGTAIGYILGQLNDQNQEYVIAYGGRALSKDERKWSVTDQECLAVIEGIKAYEHYLTSREFTVHTDHKALSYLLGLKDPSGRLGRWVVFLQKFNMNIVHKTGKLNTNADAISRIPYTGLEGTVACALTEQACNCQPLRNIQEQSHIQDNKSGVLSNTWAYQNSAFENRSPVAVPRSDKQRSPGMRGSSVNICQTAIVPDPAHDTESYDDVFKNLLLPDDDASAETIQDGKNDASQTIWKEPTGKSFVQVELEYFDPVCVVSDNTADYLTMVDIRDLQRRCSDFDFIIQYLETMEMPEDEKEQRICLRAEDQYVMQDGILYHLYQPRFKSKANQEERYILQLALPTSKRKEILRNYHDCTAGGGHFGVTRTFVKLKQKYWWPKMYQEVKDYIGSCDICQRIKVDRRQFPPPLKPLPVVSTFDRVHIDILGPLPKTKEGYQYILLIIDSSSKWSEAFALVNQEAKEIADIFYNQFICRYGAPRVLVSDRGKNFMSKLLNALCEMFRIKRHHTSSYHPQTNATVERANSTLAKSLASYVNENQTNWPDYLNSVMMAFRSTPATESTQMSPYHILFGKEMNLPVDVNLIPKPTLPNNVKQHIDNVHQSIKLYQDIAQANMKIVQDSVKEKYDLKSKEPCFRVNDRVLLRNHVTKKGLSSKLTPKWIGPFKITSRGLNHTYKIQDIQSGKIRKSYINASNLKHYQQPFDSDSSDNEEETNQPPTTVQTQELEKTQNNQTSQNQQIQPETQQNIDPPQKTPIVQKILKTKMYSKTRYFYVQWDNHSRSWLEESKIEQDLLDKYWKTHTRKGTRRKYKTRHFVRTN